MNEQYWEEPHGPVFLFIGGESPISEVDVLSGMTLSHFHTVYNRLAPLSTPWLNTGQSC